jgi:hypothetical protein
MNAALRLVRERMPNIRDQTAFLFESDETFRELCEEYQMCTEAASRMEGEQAGAALQKEYAALLLRLEGELLRYLQEHPQT